MPILEYHLVDNQYSEAQCEKLLVESTRLYAEVLRSPPDRIRVFIHLHKPSMVAVAGVPVSRGGEASPYFRFLVLQGRPLEERQRLLSGFTELLVDILGARKGSVRGGCWPIPPEDWAIGGVPASVARAAEVAARASETHGMKQGD